MNLRITEPPPDLLKISARREQKQKIGKPFFPWLQQYVTLKNV